MPACIAKYSLHCSVAISTVDRKFKECLPSISGDPIAAQLPRASADEVNEVQEGLVVRMLTELVRHIAEIKDPQASARMKVLNMCTELLAVTSHQAKKMLEAFVVILNDKAYSAQEVMQVRA